MAKNRYFKGQTKIPTKEMSIKQARYRYRIIDNSKGEVSENEGDAANNLHLRIGYRFQTGGKPLATA
jgi:hypothetical protein